MPEEEVRTHEGVGARGSYERTRRRDEVRSHAKYCSNAGGRLGSVDGCVPVVRVGHETRIGVRRGRPLGYGRERDARAEEWTDLIFRRLGVRARSRLRFYDPATAVRTRG